MRARRDSPLRSSSEERDFPPRWGPTIIGFEDFADLFDEDFCLAYREKLEEYGTPVPERVYCDHRIQASESEFAEKAVGEICGRFLGVLEEGGKMRCGRCMSWRCLECREAVDPPISLDTPFYVALKPHVCDKAKVDNEAEALDQETKGKEWQECPNSDCKIKCDLRDGCNAITCICGCTFCFICGEETGHDSSHWTQGKSCPRWGRLDAQNPMFDTPDPEPVAPLPGNVVINLNIGRNVLRAEVDERLHVDTEEALTLVEEIGSEAVMLTDGDEPIPQVILEMEDLLIDLKENMTWLEADAALSHGVWFFRAVLMDPVAEAVEATNFFIRDERLSRRFHATHAAALKVTGEDSVLFTIPVIEIFERYLNVHKARYVESLRRFEFIQNGGRAPWMRMRNQNRNIGRRASQ